MNDKSIIPFRQRITIATLFACVCTSSYLLINHMPLREPILLWKSPIDELIPFVPWTIWPYIVLLLTDYFFPLMIKDRLQFYQTMRAYAIAAALAFACWALIPTTLPRDGIIPLGDTLSERTYRYLISMDPPNNCFPSGHITIPTVLFWSFSIQWPQYKKLIWITFIMLSITILTTKQHYVLDLIGGVLTGIIGIWISRWWTQYTMNGSVKTH